MEDLTKILSRILKGNKALKQGVEEARIIEVWPLSVGETLAKHTRAVKVKGKTLIVEVDHPIWRQELHSNKMLALKRLNEKLAELISPHCVMDDIFLVGSTPQAKRPLR